MKSALVESATEILGKVKGSQPDWFCESEEVISPYTKSKNICIQSDVAVMINRTWSTFDWSTRFNEISLEGKSSSKRMG